jgi:hypothetical protein
MMESRRLFVDTRHLSHSTQRQPVAGVVYPNGTEYPRSEN